jgi:hypothetical protein
MIDVTLMEWRINEVEQPPRNAPTLEPTNPSFCGNLRR